MQWGPVVKKFLHPGMFLYNENPVYKLNISSYLIDLGVIVVTPAASNSYFHKIRKISDGEMNDRSCSNPHSGLIQREWAWTTFSIL